MSNKNIKQLPFWETVARSFKYVLKNRQLLKILLLIAAILTVVQVILKTPIMCVYNESFCKDSWQNTFSGFIMVLTAVGIIINYCRSIVCKDVIEFTSLKFLKRMGLYLLWSVLMTFVVGAPITAAIIILSILGLSSKTILLVSVFLFFVFGVLFAPLIVSFPALAVDDYKIINLAKLFKITKGNKMAVFFGQFVIMFPYMLLSKAFIYIYTLIGVNNLALNSCFVFLTSFFVLIDASFRGAFFAHIYQFLKYYDKDK